MIVLYVFGVALIGHTTATTPVVNIPRPNLRAVIKKALDKPEDAAVTVADMAGLTDLSATEAEIRNLTGLEYGVNLTVLILNNNRCSDLSPLKGLTNLEALDLGGNPIVDLSPLAGLTKLEFLEIPRL